MTHNLELEEYYSSWLNEFTAVLEIAIATSHSTASLQAGERRFWASVLFTRVCSFSISILYLCPGSKLSRDYTHWDFGAIASLSRNVFECALNFFYLGVEAITDEEWLARLRVMELHDCMTRFRMFRDFDANHKSLKGFEGQASELRTILQQNGFFLSLPDRQRKMLLKGKQASILKKDEILQRMGETWPGTRGYYRFLSSHIHSFPLSFSRMAEHGRGTGDENEVDKKYISVALEFCTKTLKRCTDDMRKIFADIAEFPSNSFNWDAVKRAH